MKRRTASIQRCEACRARSAATSTGVWLTTLSSALWFQTSVSSGAMLRSPTRSACRSGAKSVAEPFGQRREHLELVAELRVQLGVGLVAARRHVEVVQLDLARQPQAQVPAVVLAAPGERLDLVEGQLREHRHAVIAGLAVERVVAKAQRLEIRDREQLVPDLGLLQAQHVRVDRAHQPLEPGRGAGAPS